MNKTLKYGLLGLLALPTGFGLASLFDQRSFKESEQIHQVVPPLVPVTPLSYEFIRIKPDGTLVYKLIAEEGITKERIIQDFNSQDNVAGDFYQEIDAPSIVTSKGKPLPELKIGQEVYIRAKHKLKEPQKREQKNLQNIPTKEKPAQLQESRAITYALLINNDSNEERHLNNLKEGYKTLRSKGVDACTIYVSSEGNRNENCEDSSLQLNYHATPGDVLSALYALRKRVTPKDTFFLYITGHGAEGTLALSEEGNSLEYSTLRHQVEALHPKLIIALSDQCYGGGLVEEFGKSSLKTIALSPTTSTSPTSCQFFTPYFWDALRTNGLDLNGDKLTSLREATVLGLAAYVASTDLGKKISLETLKEFKERLVERGAFNELIANLSPRLITTAEVYDATITGRLLKESREKSLDSLLTLTPTNYQKEVLESNLPVVVDIYTSWCHNCKELEQQVKELLPSYANKIKFTRIDYESPGARETVRRYTPVEVRGYPTLLLVTKGKVISLKEGRPHSKEDLEYYLKTTFSLK